LLQAGIYGVGLLFRQRMNLPSRRFTGELCLGKALPDPDGYSQRGTSYLIFTRLREGAFWVGNTAKGLPAFVSGVNRSQRRGIRRKKNCDAVRFCLSFGDRSTKVHGCPAYILELSVKQSEAAKVLCCTVLVSSAHAVSTQFWRKFTKLAFRLKHGIRALPAYVSIRFSNRQTALPRHTKRMLVRDPSGLVNSRLERFFVQLLSWCGASSCGYCTIYLFEIVEGSPL
jgi:hypothetical protein